MVLTDALLLNDSKVGQLLFSHSEHMYQSRVHYIQYTYGEARVLALMPYDTHITGCVVLCPKDIEDTI